MAITSLQTINYVLKKFALGCTYVRKFYYPTLPKEKEDTIYNIGIFGVATDHKHALVN